MSTEFEEAEFRHGFAGLTRPATDLELTHARLDIASGKLEQWTSAAIARNPEGWQQAREDFKRAFDECEGQSASRRSDAP